jgi:hypothetical protein
MDFLWPLVGSLGWLLVPKCPLCLMAYISMGTGLTVSLAFSQFLRITLLFLAASFCLAGLWRIWKKTVSLRDNSLPTTPAPATSD